MVDEYIGYDNSVIPKFTHYFLIIWYVVGDTHRIPLYYIWRVYVVWYGYVYITTRVCIHRWRRIERRDVGVFIASPHISTTDCIYGFSNIDCIYLYRLGLCMKKTHLSGLFPLWVY